MRFASQRLKWMTQQPQFGQLSFVEVFYLLNYYESNGDEKIRFDVVTAWINCLPSKLQDVHPFKALLSTVDLSKITSETRIDLEAKMAKEEFRYVKKLTRNRKIDKRFNKIFRFLTAG